jgi:DNA-binding CsgD family transcriptional regulator
MDKERLDRLTEQQRACLRMVYMHMTSKEIAPRLGIEPGSVDQHIKAAMRTLGVGERRAAARMLAEHEGRGEREPARAPELAVHEDQERFEAFPHLPLRGLQPPLPIWGGKPSDLSPLKRLAWIFAIMLMVALSFGVFLAGLEALSRVGRAIH